MVCVAWQPLPLQHHFCHAHTTVTGGTAKQLLGSSTDWCATTIVTSHMRGATSTHTHIDGKDVWCGQCVETVVCINTCMVTSLCHTICVCHLISQVCHHPFHHPLAFLSLTPFCVCGIVKWYSRSLCGFRCIGVGICAPHMGHTMPPIHHCLCVW